MRKQIFVIVAILLSTLGVTATCAGVFLLLQRPSYRTLGSLRQASLVRAYLFDGRLRRFAAALHDADPHTDLFKTMWDTNTGVMLSRHLYRAIDMDGVPKYGYKPGLRKLAFWAGSGDLLWKMETEDTPALRAAVTALAPRLFLTATYDEYGFRRSDPSLTDGCQLHVMFLGDSFTDGMWVSDDQTFANHYARLARVRSGVRACPVNAGVNGYGSLEERYVLEHEFEHAGRPSIVFLMYFPNDVDQDYGAVIAGGLPDADRLWRRSLDEVRRMARFAAERHSTLVLVAIPVFEQILQRSSRDHYQHVLRTFAAAEHIPFVDLIDGLSGGDPRPLYFAIDPHFTPKGHQVTAELLYAATKDMLR